MGRPAISSGRLGIVSVQLIGPLETSKNIKLPSPRNYPRFWG